MRSQPVGWGLVQCDQYFGLILLQLKSKNRNTIQGQELYSEL